MWFHVDTSSGVPIYLQIVNQVKRATASGLLAEGDQMPSVRDLAVQLTVNPNTVAKAYQELEREGVIKSSRGRGTFIAGEGVKLIHKERVRVVQEAIDKVLVEAHHLGISNPELSELFTKRLEEWKVKQ